ncbi:hypothetical protein [Rhodococcus wratislaviensis]
MLDTEGLDHGPAVRVVDSARRGQAIDLGSALQFSRQLDEVVE